MKATDYGWKTFILVLWSVLLTGITGVCGGAPLIALRKTLGRGPYWLLTFGLVISFWGLKFPFIAVPLLLVATVVGAYCELETLPLSLFAKGCWAVSLVSISTFSFAVGLVAWTRIDYRAQITTTFEQVVGQVIDLKAKPIPIDDILYQMPSGIIIFLVCAVYFAALFENRFARWLHYSPTQNHDLTEFRVHEIFVWFFIASLAGTFLDHGNKIGQIISMNVFNVALLLYFFQGLAVVVKFFDSFKVGAVWRILWTTLLVMYLFPMVSFVGLMDLWANFRVKFEKRTTQIDKSV